jgi:hypothetical protein
MVTSNNAVRRFLQESLATDRQGGKLLKKKLGSIKLKVTKVGMFTYTIHHTILH